MKGHSGQKCNWNVTSIPFDRTRIPFDHTSMPFDRFPFQISRKDFLQLLIGCKQVVWLDYYFVKMKIFSKILSAGGYCESVNYMYA